MIDIALIFRRNHRLRLMSNWVLIIFVSSVSASSATVYAYLGEMHASTRRAAAIAWGSAFISFSFIILPG